MIITISHQYGSGGRLIGKTLADRLSLPFYDGDFWTDREGAGESASIGRADTFRITESLMKKSVTLYEAAEKLKKGAESIAYENCVACGSVSSCFENSPSVFAVFIHAPRNQRVKRYISEHHMEEETAERVVDSADRIWETFYEIVSGKKWGHCDNYSLSMDSSRLGINGTVDFILSAFSLQSDVHVC